MQMKGEKHIYFSSCVSSVQTSTQLQSMSDLCDKLGRGLLITGKKSTFLLIFDYLCRKKLIWSAVPTLVDCPNPPQVHESKRRKLKRQRVVESSKDISRREESCAAAATPFQQSDADKSPQKKRLKLSNQRLRTKVGGLKKKLCQPSKQRSQAKEIKEATDVISRHLHEPALTFFQTQVKLSSRKRLGYRWTDSDKSFALSLCSMPVQSATSFFRKCLLCLLLGLYVPVCVTSV